MLEALLELQKQPGACEENARQGLGKFALKVFSNVEQCSSRRFHARQSVNEIVFPATHQSIG